MGVRGLSRLGFCPSAHMPGPPPAQRARHHVLIRTGRRATPQWPVASLMRYQHGSPGVRCDRIEAHEGNEAGLSGHSTYSNSTTAPKLRATHRVFEAPPGAPVGTRPYWRRPGFDAVASCYPAARCRGQGGRWKGEYFSGCPACIGVWIFRIRREMRWGRLRSGLDLYSCFCFHLVLGGIYDGTRIPHDFTALCVAERRGEGPMDVSPSDLHGQQRHLTSARATAA